MREEGMIRAYVQPFDESHSLVSESQLNNDRLERK